MAKDIKQIIDERMLKLPPTLKEAIDSSDWERKIFDIGKKYSLHIDDLEYLETELSATIVGLSDRNEFAESLKTHLGLKDNVVEGIITDINNKIFEGIREKLQGKMSEDGSDKMENSSVVMSPTEKRVLKKAGVFVGEDTQEDEATGHSNEPQAVPSVPTPQNSPAAKVSEPKQEEQKTPMSGGVFKTQSATPAPSEELKSIDPYREPID